MKFLVKQFANALAWFITVQFKFYAYLMNKIEENLNGPHCLDLTDEQILEIAGPVELSGRFSLTEEQLIAIVRRCVK